MKYNKYYNTNSTNVKGKYIRYRKKDIFYCQKCGKQMIAGKDKYYPVKLAKVDLTLKVCKECYKKNKKEGK